MAVCDNSSCFKKFRLAVNELHWQLETHIRGVWDSVDNSSLNVKAVLDNYTTEESIETILATCRKHSKSLKFKPLSRTVFYFTVLNW